MYQSNTDGHIWVDAQGRLIPLTQHFTGHIDTVDPTHLWNSRVTKQGFHAVPPPISKGDAASSTAITQQPSPHTTPTSPIQGAPGSVPDGVNIVEDILRVLHEFDSRTKNEYELLNNLNWEEIGKNNDPASLGHLLASITALVKLENETLMFLSKISKIDVADSDINRKPCTIPEITFRAKVHEKLLQKLDE